MSGGPLPAPYPRPSHWPARLAWVVLSIAAVLPVLLAEYPPLLDYPEWVFMGDLARAYFLPGDPRRDEVAALYVPQGLVPNAAATAGIAFLRVWLPAELAGRAALAVTVLLFGWAFGRLVRVVQQRPTPVEFLGFAWTYSYFLYFGYLSFLSSVAVALLAVLPLRRLGGDERETAGAAALRGADLRATLAAAALGAVAFVCHLFGWLVFAVVVGVFAVWTACRGRWQRALAILLTLLPSLVLLWLVAGLGEIAPSPAASPPGDLFADLAGLRPYLVRQRLDTLGQALVLFLRLDPLPPPLPVGWLNAAGFALAGSVILLSLDRRRLVASTPLLLAGLALCLIGLAFPFDRFRFADYNERLALPAALLIAAALGYRALDAPRLALAGGFGLAVLGYHAVEYRTASDYLHEINRTALATIPAGAPTLSIGVRRPPFEAACGPPESPNSLGLLPAQHAGLYRLIATGRLRANVFGTGLLRARFPPGEPLDLSTTQVHPAWAADPAFGRDYAREYAFVQLLGCPADIAAVRQALARDYEPVAATHGLDILRRR